MRLVVADDSGLLREGMVGLLERQGHEVVAEAASAPELLAAVRAAVADGTAPDVVLTDVRMPPSMTDDGLQAAVTIRREFPAIGILVISQYVAPAYAAELFAPGAGAGAGLVGAGVVGAGTGIAGVGAGQAGAGLVGAGAGDAGGLGYLLKDRVARVADFMRSLGIVAAGGVVVDPEVASRLIQGKGSALDALTPREREVLEMMSHGLSNQQISERLFLSAGAVAKHVANVFTKLDLPPGEDNRRVRAVLAYLTATREV